MGTSKLPSLAFLSTTLIQTPNTIAPAKVMLPNQILNISGMAAITWPVGSALNAPGEPVPCWERRDSSARKFGVVSAPESVGRVALRQPVGESATLRLGFQLSRR